MARVNSSLITARDLYRMPDDDLRHELIRGRLISEPPPGFRHGRIAMKLGSALDSYTQTQGGGVVVTCDTGFILSRNPDTVRAPDIAFVSDERVARLVDDRSMFPGAPNLAVEILSPSDRDSAIREKLADYLDNGTQEVWIVDPERREVQICRPHESNILVAAEALTAPDLLPGFRLPLFDVFGWAPPAGKR